MPAAMQPTIALHPSAQSVFYAVIAAMQDAEEMGGPGPEHYADLMDAIRIECETRLRNFRSWNREQDADTPPTAKLRLVLDVTYETGDDGDERTAADLVRDGSRCLDLMVSHAASDGLLSGPDSEMQVQSYSHRIEQL